MGIFDFLSQRNKNTASTAKDRLRILIQQERSLRGAPDYLPLLQRELLEVIKKYVNVDPDAIDIHVEKDGESEVLELSVALPDRNGAAPAEPAANAGETAAANEA
jgi:cell division topological specificity factor